VPNPNDLRRYYHEQLELAQKSWTALRHSRA